MMGRHRLALVAGSCALAFACVGHAQDAAPAPAASSPASGPADVDAGAALVQGPPQGERDTVSRAEVAELVRSEVERVLAERAVLEGAVVESEVEEIVEGQGLSLRVYGFADANLTRAFAKNPLGNYPPASPNMTVGNVNVYLAADLTHGFSSLLEVRFTYLPNGRSDPNTGQHTSTIGGDYADWGRPTRWGGVVLERVHLDYSFHGLLNLRFGQWLTPYGIWNVDHGSPSVISVVRPYPVGEQLFPVRQTGLLIHGSQLVRSVTLGYALSVSNGRGDVDHWDYDNNKALGGRLTLSTSELGNLTIGLSGYGGLATRGESGVVTPGNPPRYATASVDQFDELSFAADLQWDFRALRVQAEVIFNRVEYRDPGRRITGGFGTTAGLVPDHLAWGSYFLMGYRLPWFGIMPFVLLEQFDRGYAKHDLAVFGGHTINVVALSGGLNVRVVPSVALKAQLLYSWFPQTEYDADLPILLLQAAWAF